MWDRKETEQTKNTKREKTKIKDRIIRDIWTLYETEEEKKVTKKLENKKKLMID